jgi:hypothetical protein
MTPLLTPPALKALPLLSRANGDPTLDPYPPAKACLCSARPPIGAMVGNNLGPIAGRGSGGGCSSISAILFLVELDRTGRLAEGLLWAPLLDGKGSYAGGVDEGSRCSRNDGDASDVG